MNEISLRDNRERRLQLRKRKTLVILTLLLLLIALPAFVLFLNRQQNNKLHDPLRLNSIQQENQLPGTSAWQITNEASYDPKTFRSPSIEGYASTTSAKAGDTVSFSVSTNQPYFTVNIYRLGWYQGKGGRLMQTFSIIKGHFYPMPSMDPQTGLVQANWPVSFTVKIAPNWVTGMYLAKLIAANGKESFVTFVVRSIQPADFIFIHAATTDQAYNSWGGKSLYNYNSTGYKRAYAVSFDRPLSQGGFGNFLIWEYPMVRWLESNGYSVGYLSTEDVQSDGALLENHNGILIVGQNEYWSKEMRDNLESAVNSGVNLANFAADTTTWQIRYEPSSSTNGSIPNRIIVCYKDQALDPLYAQDNSQVTVEFQDPLLNRPPQTLLGEMYAGYFNWNTAYDWEIADASSWVFNGTGLKNGDRLPGLVGYEYDKVFANYPQPSGLAILASSPVHNIATNESDVSNATLYTAQSGAYVFSAGTIQWSWGIDSFNAVGHPDVVSHAAQKVTENILQNYLTNGPDPAIGEISPIKQQVGVYAETCIGSDGAIVPERKRANNTTGYRQANYKGEWL